MSRPLRAFEGDEARRLMAAVERIEVTARAFGARRVHTPAIVPVEVVAALRDRMAAGVVLPEIRDGLSNKVRGALCPSGGALEALPMLRSWIHSHRDLPMAIFRAGYTVWPFPDRPAEAWEELFCVSGAMAGPEGSPPQAAPLVESCLGASGVRGEWNEETWLLARPGLVLRHRGTVLAVAQPMDLAGTRLAPAYADAADRRRTARVEVFYLSERALLAAAGEPAGAAEARP